MLSKIITKIIILVIIALIIFPVLFIISPQYKSIYNLEYVNGVCVDCNRIDLQVKLVGGKVDLITMDNGEVYSVPRKMLNGVNLEDFVGKQLSFYADDAVLWYEQRIVAWNANDFIKEEGTLKETNRSNAITFLAMTVIYLIASFVFLLKNLLELWQKISVEQDKKWALKKKEATRIRAQERREKYEAKVQEYETEAKFYHAQKNTSKKKLKKRKKDSKK